MIKRVPDAEPRPLLKNLLNYCKLIKIPWDPDEDEIIERCSDILLLIKKYIKADAVEFYLVEYKTITRIEGVEERNPFKGNVKYLIENEEITAAFSAGHKTPLSYKSASPFKKEFPKGIGRGVKVPDHVLSFPILTPEGTCLGVFEFYRICNQIFKKIEISMAKCLIGWLGRSVRKRPVIELAQNKALRTWAEDFRRFQSEEMMKLEHFISSSLRVLQTTTQAEIINFYKIERGKYCMYGQVTPGVFLGKNREFLVETNLFLNAVITRQKPVQVDQKDIMTFLRLEQVQLKDDKDLTVPIRNYLCVPVGAPSSLLGIVELINKVEGKDFNQRDIEFSIHCGRLCCAAIFIDKKKSEKIETLETAKTQISVIMNYMSACPHRFDLFYKKLKEAKKPADFYKFDFCPIKEQRNYLEQYCYFIFEEVFKLKDPHDSTSVRFVDFIITMERGYRENSYHNFEHTYNVCHTMFLITRNNTHLFKELEVQTLILSALGHDIDHPGFTNKWILCSHNPLAQCYEGAFLEHHHSNICRSVIQTTGILSHLKPEDFKRTMGLIHKNIRLTDALKGLETRFKIANLLDNNKFSISNESHRELLYGLMMSSSDLGGQAKKFDINYRLYRNLYNELNAEREKCLTLGYDPPWLSLFSNRKNIPLLQVKFNEEICLPCFWLLGSILRGVTPLHQNCYELIGAWRTIGEEGIDWTEFEEEPTYKPEAH